MCPIAIGNVPPAAAGSSCAAAAGCSPVCVEQSTLGLQGPVGVAAAAAAGGAGPGANQHTPQLMRDLVQEFERVLKRVLKEELRPLRRLVGDLAYRPKSKPPEFNEYKLPAVEYYGTPQLPQLHADPPGQKAAEKMLRCSVSGCDVPEEDVLAGYIYPPRWPLYTLRELNIDVNDPLNTMLMHKSVEDKYAKLELTVMPDYKVKVLNPRLLCSSVCAFQAIKDGQVVDVRWSDLDNRQLQSCSGRLPSPQLLSIHARRAVEDAKTMRWVDKLDIPAATSADAQILHDYLVSQGEAVSSRVGSQDTAPAVPAA